MLSKQSKPHVIQGLSDINKENITTSKESESIGEITKNRDRHRKSEKSSEINKDNCIIKGYYPQTNQI